MHATVDEAAQNAAPTAEATASAEEEQQQQRGQNVLEGLKKCVCLLCDHVGAKKVVFRVSEHPCECTLIH